MHLLPITWGTITRTAAKMKPQTMAQRVAQGQALMQSTQVGMMQAAMTNYMNPHRRSDGGRF